MIGGLLDRAFEEGLKKAWGRAVALGVAGVAACIGLVCLVDALAYGPAPNVVSREAKALIVSEWSMHPEYRDAAIQKVVLERKVRRTYTGFADVTFTGQPERLLVEVVVEGGMLEVRWAAAPLKEESR